MFTSVFLVMSAPAAYADDYCITSGAQAGHGCGYPSMETCRAAASGISGTCSLAGGSTSNSNNALAFQPKRHPRRAVTNPKSNPLRSDRLMYFLPLPASGEREKNRRRVASSDDNMMAIALPAARPSI